LLHWNLNDALTVLICKRRQDDLKNHSVVLVHYNLTFDRHRIRAKFPIVRIAKKVRESMWRFAWTDVKRSWAEEGDHRHEMSWLHRNKDHLRLTQW
jgi:hypothetical protein